MIKLSASSIGTFEKCPKSYYYRYINKPDIPPKDWSFLEFGKCAHRVLELFHIDLCENVRTTDEYSDIMKRCFVEALKEYDMEILRPELGELKDVIQGYLDRLKREGLPEVIHNELSFNFKVGEFTVRGFIDRIDKIGPGEYEVVDYKTNKNPKYLKPFQLLLYALAIKEVYPDAEKISGKYVLLKHDSKPMSFKFSEKDYTDTIAKIKRVGVSIDTNEVWPKKPTFLCNWCDFQDICQNNWV